MMTRHWILACAALGILGISAVEGHAQCNRGGGGNRGGATGGQMGFAQARGPRQFARPAQSAAPSGQQLAQMYRMRQRAQQFRQQEIANQIAKTQQRELKRSTARERRGQELARRERRRAQNMQAQVAKSDDRPSVALYLARR